MYLSYKDHIKLVVSKFSLPFNLRKSCEITIIREKLNLKQKWGRSKDANLIYVANNFLIINGRKVNRV